MSDRFAPDVAHRGKSCVHPEANVEIDNAGGVVAPRRIVSTDHPINGLAEQTISLREARVIAT